MSNITAENLGWPYNLYAAISGTSIPDPDYANTRMYRYKYQRGYYFFYMLPPNKAHRMMCNFLMEWKTHRHYNDMDNMFIYIVLLHKYAYGRTYDEILYMYHNNFKDFASCIEYPQNFLDALKCELNIMNKFCTEKDLYRYEIKALQSMRNQEYFDAMFLSKTIWKAYGIEKPDLTEYTRDDKQEFCAKRGIVSKYNPRFTIDYRKFYNSGARFSTKITEIASDEKFANAFRKSQYSIGTIHEFCKYATTSFAQYLYQDDILILFSKLDGIGITVDPDFYNDCMRSAMKKYVPKKKPNKVQKPVKYVPPVPDKPEIIRARNEQEKKRRSEHELELTMYFMQLIDNEDNDADSKINAYKSDYNSSNCIVGTKAQYVDTFANATLREVEDYYSTPEYIGDDFLKSLGIYCDLPQYDQ